VCEAGCGAQIPYYKFNSTPRSIYAGYLLKTIKKAVEKAFDKLRPNGGLDELALSQSTALPTQLSQNKSPLRSNPLRLAVQLIQRREISLGRSDHDVGVCADAVDGAAAVLQPHRHFAL
jgi:hypothetical protein